MGLTGTWTGGCGPCLMWGCLVFNVRLFSAYVFVSENFVSKKPLKIVFADEMNETWRNSSNLPRITKLINSRARTCLWTHYILETTLIPLQEHEYYYFYLRLRGERRNGVWTFVWLSTNLLTHWKRLMLGGTQSMHTGTRLYRKAFRFWQGPFKS